MTFLVSFVDDTGFRALLTSELETIFSQAPEAPNSVTNPRVREAFLRATGQLAESSTAAMNSKKRIPGEEDDCPICYDTMYQVSDAQLTFCEECGNALHKECFTECISFLQILYCNICSPTDQMKKALAKVAGMLRVSGAVRNGGLLRPRNLLVHLPTIAGLSTWLVSFRVLMAAVIQPHVGRCVE